MVRIFFVTAHLSVLKVPEDWELVPESDLWWVFSTALLHNREKVLCLSLKNYAL